MLRYTRTSGCENRVRGESKYNLKEVVEIGFISIGDFHTSVQHHVACVTEVTINIAKATLYIYKILYWDTFFYCGMFRSSFEPSSSNIHTTDPL
jgi:hypothetical protein